ncbi:MAG: phosphomannomutase/phosphoglucomutase [Candidatus Brocadia sp.]|jgi:phosphomannomutase (EC 5.4.2.8)|uniref:Phosphomannomutase n=1 Tax=Candidatus Brocadia fulgida TaxID=380242 RepID=A0A0M2URG3_9BACT|nr:MAG: phosphomannomutase [Candidatus Brocadia fulgida]UJS19856.1 MAG: phosphomannomutase/phosphoglucomutase [Candidatus Brocadia sp.]
MKKGFISEKADERQYRCPGESYTITDSVCKGRQRVNYPKCNVCLERVEMRNSSQSHTEPKLSRDIFKSYDIRGKYPAELNDTAAHKIGTSIAQFFKEQDPGVKNIAVGRDMRTSSKSLANALIEGLCTAGLNVVNLGVVSTEMTYFAVGHYQYDGGIMVTASHNPAEYNGFKICRKQAIPVSFETGISRISKLTSQYHPPRGEQLGKVVQNDIFGDYKKHVLKFAGNLRHLRIVVDAGNGMAGKTIPVVCEGLPLEIIPLYFELDGTFPNHEANPLNPENMVDLQKKVRETRAHLGVAFDGDADRCFFVDETGRIIGCDIITALIARQVLEREKGATILYDLRSSWVVPEEIKAGGGVPYRERVGHAYMKATLREKNAFFGGELSGHYYFKNNYYSDSGMIAFLMVLDILSAKRVPFSNIVSPLRRYYSTGEINFEVDDKDEKIAEIARKFSDGNVDYLDGVTVEYQDWWFNVRKSNTEPLLRLNVEGKTPEIMEKGKKLLISIIHGKSA